MTHRIPYIYLFLLLLLTAACTPAERYAKRGDNYYALGEYAEAAGQYKKSYSLTPSKDKKTRAVLSFKMAECYRHYGFYSRALGSYRNALRFGYSDTATLGNIADMQKVSGDYKGAAKSYAEYLEIIPDDSIALLAYRTNNRAAEIKQKGSAYTIHMEPLFNGSRADFSPAFLDNEGSQLYFSSTRKQALGDDPSGITGEMAGDIFFAKKDEKGKWLRPEAVEGVNTDFDEGACAFSTDGRTMYLTVCKTDPQYPRMAEIWTSSRSDAAWAQPKQLKITADTLSSYAHPAPSHDGRWLYFVSDMPGGYGGMDIWRAQLTLHGVGVVENLGAEINTKRDEMFPTCRANGELYYSSNGKGGMGGLDIFKAVEDSVLHRWTVTPLPYPINSNGDDFGMTFEGLHHRGYFSSNRATGGRGWDKIYSFSHPETLQTVKGWVYEQDGYELPSAKVWMIGNDGTNIKTGVLSDGSFEQEVKPGVDYMFLASCDGYLNVQNELRVTLDSADVAKQYVLQFPLPSMNIPVLVRNVFYEFDKADLTENSCEALDRLTLMLEQNPHITIELAAHCDYRGDDAYNMKLSQRRAESVVRYLTEHGIAPDRLQAKGYGESVPKIVNKKLAEQHPFMHEGDTLSLAYILALPEEQQEICNSLNRRTEFRVLRTTYGIFEEKKESEEGKGKEE